MTPEQLQRAWEAGRIVPLAGSARLDREALAAAIGPRGLEPLQAQWGPGVVLGSGGSTGGRRWCLQPLAHLEASAAATGHWLEAQGINPAACLHLNPLPLHHVSGLLPWLRARQWRAGHRRLDPAWMRDPAQLAVAAPLDPARPAVLSLVPTQLQRLMATPEGLAWLQPLAVIWVGGAPLPSQLAARARLAGLRLAPCYGATETAAMVCALAPDHFLAGVASCGAPLADVEVRLAASGAVEVRCGRLSPGWLEHGQLQLLPRSAAGWWRSGDAGRLGSEGLELLGRLDGAIHSGGETVFPESLESRLLAQAQAAGLPLQAVLLLPIDDPDWGQRLVALVRPEAGAPWLDLQAGLQQLCEPWAPAERPVRWLRCPELAPSPLGKWQRSRWRAWVGELEAMQTPTSAAADVDPL
ncbi:MAG: AMP-binding protein [Cyanobium sp. LacPavin_0818_WC50_MAG_67_9]|nr:AMP-binding protein [Cyanobium sp. LacPavin_0818_WC50_MAG_67_9]